MPAEALDPLFQQARSFTRQREYPRAIAIYREILEHDPDSVDGNEGMAMTCFVAGELVSAEQHFEQLIRLQPMEARHFVNLGAVLNRQRRHKDAAEALRKAIQRNRRSPFCGDQPDRVRDTGGTRRRSDHAGEAPHALCALRNKP